MTAFVLLVPAWVMSTQAFNGPDEASHFLRALGIANGQLLGRHVPYFSPALSRRQNRWASEDTTLIWVPANLRPGNIDCYDPRQLPPCWAATTDGNFPPLPYLLPAVALKASPNLYTAWWLTRFASALPSLLLLLVALAVVWDGTALSVLGLLAAITPMVLFSSSVLNSSGPGITGAIAFGAAALRLARDRARAPAWVFAALAVTGFVAMLSGPIGPVFVAAFLLLGALLLGRGGIAQLWRQRQRAVSLTAGTLIVALVLALVWRHYAGVAPGLFGISPLFPNLWHGVLQLPGIFRDSLGTFGLENVPLPQAAYWAGWIFELGLAGAALFFARRRDRAVLVVVMALAVAFPVLFWAWVDRLTGFALSGREVLPIIAMIPMAAGEVLYRGRPRVLGTRAGLRVLAAALLAIAVFQGYAWWINARTWSESPTDRLWFPDHAMWAPPLGWIFWIVLLLLAVVAMISFALFTAAEPSAEQTASPEQTLPVPANWRRERVIRR